MSTLVAALVRAHRPPVGGRGCVAVDYAQRPTEGDRRRIASRRCLGPVPRAEPQQPALMDPLVHGRDITIPLGIERPMPTDAAVAGFRQVWSMGWLFHARRRMRGMPPDRHRRPGRCRRPRRGASRAGWATCCCSSSPDAPIPRSTGSTAKALLAFAPSPTLWGTSMIPPGRRPPSQAAVALTSRGRSPVTPDRLRVCRRRRVPRGRSPCGGGPGPPLAGSQLGLRLDPDRGPRRRRRVRPLPPSALI